MYEQYKIGNHLVLRKNIITLQKLLFLLLKIKTLNKNFFSKTSAMADDSLLSPSFSKTLL